MIVRILGDACYDVPATDLPAIEKLDDALASALDRGDEAAFATALADLVREVRHVGSERQPDDIEGTSDLVVPHEESNLAEVRALLAEDA